MATTEGRVPLEAPLWERPFDDLLAEAVRFHGHLCPGQVLGVRMVRAGCREVGIERTLKHADYGKMAATFVDVARGAAVRVVARDDARAVAPNWAPGDSDPRRAQIAGYRVMPEPELLRIEAVTVNPGWLDRPRVRVSCEACGDGISYGREILILDGSARCRPCAGEGYCRSVQNASL